MCRNSLISLCIMPDIKNIDNLHSSLNLINVFKTALLTRAGVKTRECYRDKDQELVIHKEGGLPFFKKSGFLISPE